MHQHEQIKIQLTSGQHSPWGRKESDMTEQLHFHFHF